MTEPQVALIFPPLVESSFGGYYPSTAVLAAWLDRHGLSSLQIDLNAEFADYLLTSGALDALAAGKVPGISAEELPAACARWALKNREQLIDDSGVMHFGPTTPLGYVMEELARPFVVDPEPDLLFGTEQTAAPWPLRWHAEFMASRVWSELLPASVRLVGISIPMGPQILSALLLARTLRETGFDGRIVLGGAVISLMDDANLERLLRAHQAVDAAVRFDGEHPLLALAQQAGEGRWRPDSVPGASHVDDAGSYHTVAPKAGPALTSLPVPRYDHAIARRAAAGAFSVTQARGCYWGKCDYCDFVELYDGSPPYRGRHATDVVDEMVALNEMYGATRFTLVTESIPPAFARRMSALLLERGLSFTWDSFAMADRRFDANLLRLMAEAGCEVLVIGLETMTTRVLNLVHKSADQAENIRFLTEAREAGMRLSVNLVPDLPSTTYQEALESLELLGRYRSCLDSVSVFPFEATRSSRVGQAPADFGLVPVGGPSARAQAQYTLNNAGCLDPAMSDAERAEVHDLYRRFARDINRERMTAGNTGGAEPAMLLPSDTRLRMAIEAFDWHRAPAGAIVATHILNREVIRIPRRADEIVRPLLGGQSFSVGEFHERSGLGDRSPRLLQNLLDAQLAVLVSGGAN